LKAVEIYDPATDSWSAAAPLPTARAKLSAAEVNGKIYVFGGATSWNINTSLWADALNTVEIYDPSMNTWTTGTAMPTARNGLAAVAVNGKIYALGGSVPNSFPPIVALNTLEIYDPPTDTWSVTGAAMPTARVDLAAATVNAKIYAAGGGSAVGGVNPLLPINTVEVYDTGTNTWATVAPMTNNRESFAASDANGLVYVMGGNLALSSVEQYTPLVILNVFVKN